MIGRGLRALAAGVALATLVGAPALAAEELTIDSVDTSDLPEVSIVITLPSSMAGIRPGAEDFAVLVDGTRPRLDVFAAVSAPLEVVLVLDTSGSMAGEPLQQAQEAAAAFVAAMPGTASVTVVAFGSTAAVVAGPEDDAIEAIEALQAEGETALYDAIGVAAGQFAPEAETRRVMIVLSDGGDTISTTTLADARAAATTSGAEIHAVALATSDTDQQALSTISRGSVLTATAADELADLYADLAVALTGQYRLAFQADAAGPTEIRVLVNAGIGVASASVLVEFPEPGQIVTARPGEEPPVTITVDPAVPVTIATPGLLGSPWTLPAGVGLVFLGSLVTLWLTLRNREDQPPPFEVVQRPDPEAPSGIIGSLAGRARSLGDRFAERSASNSIDSSLDRAGINLRPGEFVVVAGTGIVVSTLAGLTIAGLPGAIILGLGAGLAPRAILRFLTERRGRAFADQLEGTLQIIAGSLRAGYGLTQSISTVAEESPAPTSVEFNRVVVENRLGRTIEQSMAAMAVRMDNEDLGWVVEAIEIQHEVGGDLAEVLDTVTTTIRDRNQIKRQVKALSAEGRISAFILLALPFAIAGFIAMISPDYLAELTGTTLGRIMLAGAAVLMMAGAAWIKKIIKVEF